MGGSRFVYSVINLDKHLLVFMEKVKMSRGKKNRSKF